MVCFIYKWKISQALDTGKDFSVALVRHMDNCDSCRSFAGLSKAVSGRLRAERTTFLKQDRGDLTSRIIESLDNGHRVVSMPGRKINRRLPAMAAALALIALTLTIVFQFSPKPTEINEFSLRDISRQVASQKPIQEIVDRVESPMEREMRGIGKTLQSAADYLLAQLDFKIGQS